MAAAAHAAPKIYGYAMLDSASFWGDGDGSQPTDQLSVRANQASLYYINFTLNYLGADSSPTPGA
eukprot:153192-Karenia_brevis.AAC.1